MLIVFAALMIAGAVMFLFLNSWIEETRALALRDPDQAAREAAGMLMLLGAVGGVSAVAFGVYCGLLGRRTLRSSRFPPPGTKVLLETKVITGDPARRRGTLFVVLAGTLVMAGAIFPFVVWRMVHVLGQTS